MTAEIKLLANVARVEWIILELVIEAEIKAGPSNVYDVQLGPVDKVF